MNKRCNKGYNEMPSDPLQEAKRQILNGTNSSVSVEEVTMNPLPGTAVHPNQIVALEDKKFMLETKNYIFIYEGKSGLAHEKIVSNNDIAMAAVNSYSRALKHASDELKCNREIV